MLIEPPDMSGGLGSTTEPDKIIWNGSKPIGNQRDYKHNVSQFYEPVRVQSVDAGAFLAALVNASGFVEAKIDIEGTEYRLFPEIMRRYPGTLCALDLLEIEWHEWAVPSAKGKTGPLKSSLSGPQCKVHLLQHE